MTASVPASPRICVVGSTMIDLIVNVPRLPKLGETLIGSRFTQGFGGKGANQAVMAARLGGHVAMVAKLGRDSFGAATLENLRAQGISTAHVAFDPEQASGVAPIFVDPEGRNMIVIVPGANDTLSAAEVEAARDEIAEADVVVCQCEVPEEADLAAFAIAKTSGACTILNPAPARALPPALLRLTDVIVPNETEAELLTGIDVHDTEGAAAAARALQASGPRTVILTLGDRGAVVRDDEDVFSVRAVPVRAVDSTGAGDAFVGTLAYELGLGTALPTAVLRAGAVAALSVTRTGTQTSFPDRAAVDNFLQHLAEFVP